ncbi:MAG: TonB-dependent receptor plug domain-containing protein, partial [Zoogloeaceae bacterium]|nr:TonB-dependent receptor plug domain-containing protein [Zoogloeaceae bacterium]
MSIPFHRRALASAVCVCLFSTSAFAQSADEADDDDAVLVTATRQPMRANELLSDTTVIGKKEIEAAGPASTVTDLLSRQPGLEVKADGGPGSSSSVFMRGTSAQQTLVLIDGMRVGSASLGYANWAAIPLQQIERIEILRGSASSLYGADAVGGVVQLFTRKGKGKPTFYGEAGIGSHHAATVSAGFSGSLNDVSYSLNVANQSTRGFSATKRESYNYNPDHDGFRKQSASGRLAWRILPGHEIGATILYSEDKADYDSRANADDYREERLSALSLYSENQLSDIWTSTLRIGQTVDQSRAYDGYPSPGRNDKKLKTTRNQYQWQNDLKLPVGTALFALEKVEEKLSASDHYAKTRRDVKSVLAGW